MKSQSEGYKKFKSAVTKTFTTLGKTALFVSIYGCLYYLFGKGMARMGIFAEAFSAEGFCDLKPFWWPWGNDDMSSQIFFWKLSIIFDSQNCKKAKKNEFIKRDKKF